MLTIFYFHPNKWATTGAKNEDVPPGDIIITAKYLQENIFKCEKHGNYQIQGK